MACCHEAESIVDLSNCAGGGGAEWGRDNFGKRAVNAQKRDMCGFRRKNIYMALSMSR